MDHLFRHEAGKLVSVLTRIFGPENIDIAEDVVQDSMIEAMNHWLHEGIPVNPPRETSNSTFETVSFFYHTLLTFLPTRGISSARARFKRVWL